MKAQVFQKNSPKTMCGAVTQALSQGVDGGLNTAAPYPNPPLQALLATELPLLRSGSVVSFLIAQFEPICDCIREAADCVYAAAPRAQRLVRGAGVADHGENGDGIQDVVRKVHRRARELLVKNSPGPSRPAVLID